MLLLRHFQPPATPPPLPAPPSFRHILRRRRHYRYQLSPSFSAVSSFTPTAAAIVYGRFHDTPLRHYMFICHFSRCHDTLLLLVAAIALPYVIGFGWLRCRQSLTWPLAFHLRHAFLLYYAISFTLPLTRRRHMLPCLRYALLLFATFSCYAITAIISPRRHFRRRRCAFYIFQQDAAITPPSAISYAATAMSFCSQRVAVYVVQSESVCRKKICGEMAANGA